jgi:hypothetical protein
METLNKMMLATVDGGFLLGFSIGSRINTNLILSHLLLANGNLIFLAANCEKLHPCVDSSFRENFNFG